MQLLSKMFKLRRHIHRFYSSFSFYLQVRTLVFVQPCAPTHVRVELRTLHELTDRILIDGARVVQGRIDHFE